MINVEPAVTPYDLHFRLGRVPVRIHPLFWLVSILMASRVEPHIGLLFILAEIVALLVHEMGHVLAFRWFGYPSRIVLHALGGLAISDGGYSDAYGSSTGPRYRGVVPLTGWPQIVVSFAGPLAGFIFGGLIVAGLYAWGRKVPFLFDTTIGRGQPIESINLAYLVFYSLYINVVWGLVNLLPIFPLDGGHIARELLLMANPRTAMVATHQLSLATAILAALAVLLFGREEFGAFPAIMAAMLAFQNFQILQALRGSGGYGPGGFGSGRDW